jgi:hypothetical protein
MRTLARLALIAVLAISVWFAFVMRPAEIGIPLDDILIHGLSFYFLTLSAGAAFPQVRLRNLIAIMLIAGAAVEGIQAIPLIGRDASVSDWIADGVGVLAAAAILTLIRDILSPAIHD